MHIKRPPWLRVKTSWGEGYRRLKSLLADSNLHTVCQEANCPNINHCFENKTATFLILGNICTRGCRFCDIKKGAPLPMDSGEPKRVAEAVKKLGLEYAVITSVTRDDLSDGGASIFSQTVQEIRNLVPNCKVELLIPDFLGSFKSLKMVLDGKPDVLNHNLETVKRLYPQVRKGADYQRSLNLLRMAKNYDQNLITKSGIMLGLGEGWEEIVNLMKDLRNVGCDLLTIGQYLSPSREHLPVLKYYHPDEFVELKRTGERMGFFHVESGPLVRSSYQAHEQMKNIPKECFTKEGR
ncbi:MAG: lipoyl synthase [candidate division Zixibacteria bacterium]|nr:lipoyl synthase [candidate division Zixibacteria bacterium]